MSADTYNKREINAGRLLYRHITLLVRFYQEHNGLTVDGEAGPLTRAALDGETSHGQRPPVPAPVPSEPVPSPEPTPADDRPARVWPLPDLVIARDDGTASPREPRITSGFGPRPRKERPNAHHDGADLFYAWLDGDPMVPVGDGEAARGTDGRPRWWIPAGTPAIASAAGVVEVAREGKTGFRVWVRHYLPGTGELGPWRTGYFHLRDLAVKEGDPVEAGDWIGEVGDNPIDLDAEHLHFEVHRGDLKAYPAGLVDPATWLEGAGSVAL